jgi:hypothetical protein
VLDEIDRLVDETMAAGVDASGRPLDDYCADRYDRCPRCHGDWHGLATPYCVGPFAEGEAIEMATYVDQVSGVEYGYDPAQYSRDQVAEMAARTAIPRQMMTPFGFSFGETFGESVSGQVTFTPLIPEDSEIVGGPCVLTGVPPFAPIGLAEAFDVDALDEDDRIALAGAAFIIPESQSRQSFTALVDPRYAELLDAVVAMIGEVCGIFLPDNNIERVLETVREMTQSARENRERRDRIRCHLLNHDTAPPEGYTLADLAALREDITRRADDRREAMQRLQSRRDHEQTAASHHPRWEITTGSAMCNPPSADEAPQQDSSPQQSRNENL